MARRPILSVRHPLVSEGLAQLDHDFALQPIFDFIKLLTF